MFCKDRYCGISQQVSSLSYSPRTRLTLWSGFPPMWRQQCAIFPTGVSKCRGHSWEIPQLFRCEIWDQELMNFQLIFFYKSNDLNISSIWHFIQLTVHLLWKNSFPNVKKCDTSINEAIKFQLTCAIRCQNLNYFTAYGFD